MTMRVARHLAIAGMLLFGWSDVGAAQLFTPTFMAPQSASDIGIYVSDAGEFALEGILRRAFGTFDVGLRAGVADTEDLTLLLGGEIRNPLEVDAPIDVALTGAAQGAFADVSAGGILLGASIGVTLAADELSLTPYIHPRAAMLKFGESDWDLELLGDVGLDVRVGANLEIRVGVGFDDPSADWGIGLAWR